MTTSPNKLYYNLSNYSNHSPAFFITPPPPLSHLSIEHMHPFHYTKRSNPITIKKECLKRSLYYRNECSSAHPMSREGSARFRRSWRQTKLTFESMPQNLRLYFVPRRPPHGRCSALAISIEICT